jgi:hypothetical protein
MRSVYWEFAVIIGVAVVLLFIDRITRIQPMITAGTAVEGFQMPVLFSGLPRMCGVGMQSCPDPTKCGNGFCINTNPLPLVEKMPLPVLPPPSGTFQ